MWWQRGQAGAVTPIILKGGGLRTHIVPPLVPTGVQRPQRGCRRWVARGHLSQSRTLGHQDVTRGAVSCCIGGVLPPLDGASSPRLWCHRRWGDSSGDSHPCSGFCHPSPTKTPSRHGMGEGDKGAGPPEAFCPPFFLKGLQKGWVWVPVGDLRGGSKRKMS